MKKNNNSSLLLLVGVTLGVVAVVVLGWWVKKNFLTPTDRSLRSLTLVTPTNQQIPLQVEVVADAASITRGLSGRSSIGSDGMLFRFAFPGRYKFWMKEMNFAIDIIWIYQKEVIGITAAAPFPQPGAATDQLPQYSPPDIVDMVLEVPAGFSQAEGIEVGSRLVIGSGELE